MTQKILIVSDELKLVDALREYLYLAGFETSYLCDGAEVTPWIRENHPNVVLLNGHNGIDTCKDIRTISDVPIIMMLARIDEVDRTLGFELGADDYICKPSSPREVVARVKAVLRRTGNEQIT